MKSRQLHRYTIPAFAVLFFILSFIVGFYVGKQHSTFASVNLQNKESDIQPAADFAPFWKVWKLINEKYPDTKTTDQDKVWGAIQGLVSSLDDPYSVFMLPQQAQSFEEDIQGEFSGVGMEVGVKDKVLTVIAPLKDTPAERAGIKPGDKIYKIGDKVTADLSIDEAVKLIRGEPGTVVSITVFHEGETEPTEIKITRSTIAIPTIETELRSDGIFVISLYSFTANSADLFRDALKEYKNTGSKKLILDLRNNPGGYLESAIDMASWFLPSGTPVVIEDFGKEHTEKIYRSKGYDGFKDTNMIILVDGGSASASEILAGALSEHGKAKLVGTKTYGKGSVQELVQVTKDTALKITVAKWLTPNRVSISAQGLKPDVAIEITKEDKEKKRDPQMEKAVELLK